MLTLSYGQLPSKEILTANMEGDTYEMQLVGRDADVVTEAVNQGIDAHLEAIMFVQFSAGHKLGLRIEKESIHTLLRRLVELWENGNEEAGDLASCILQTLDVEWI